jgi:hypothetical protein
VNLDTATIVLRPRGVGEIIDLSLRFCMGPAMGSYLRLSGWVLAPFYVGCLILRYGAGWHWSWVWLMAAMLSVVLQAPFTIAVSRILFSEAVTPAQALRMLSSCRGVYARALGLLLALAVFAGFTLVMIPWTCARLVFLDEVALLEGFSTGQMGRCRQLATGRSGVYAFLLLLWVGRFGAVLVAELLGNAIVDDVLQLGQPFGTLLEDGGSPYALLGFFASIPFAATARFLEYIDTRTRSDGWDIQLRFIAITSRALAKRRVA